MLLIIVQTFCTIFVYNTKHDYFVSITTCGVTCLILIFINIAFYLIGCAITASGPFFSNNTFAVAI